MNALLASWRNEVEKLWLRKRTKAVLALAVLIPVMFTLGIGFLGRALGLSAALGRQVSLITLNVVTGFLLPLYLFMAAADLFPGETSARTMKLMLVRPVTRAKLFAAKVLALGTAAAAILAAAGIASAVSGLLSFSASPVHEWTDSLIAYTVSIVPLAALSLIAVWIAMFFANSAAALGSMILVYAAAKLLPVMFPAFAIWSPFSYTDWHTLWVGAGAGTDKLLQSFFILIAYSMMAYVSSVTRFERKSY
ncbi:ABC transporter permease [Paenibacillus rubinfantis]|uniref:ABC transporter permease n=1 Tax=Paenibacillus rubinfantis TaxID=1720296 RepID=UPI00073ECC89|nr:ABC transporter permease [Paenibacillus rubinfantis]